MTASVGLAERIEYHAGEWRLLVDAADQRMYAAKQSGKDRVVAGPHVLAAALFTGSAAPAPTLHAPAPAPRGDPGAGAAP